MGPDFSLQ